MIIKYLIFFALATMVVSFTSSFFQWQTTLLQDAVASGIATLVVGFANGWK